MGYSRRDFGKLVIGGTSAAAATLAGQKLLGASEAKSQAASHAPAILNRQGAGCIEGDFGSKFAGVQIGSVVWYSYRQMPTLDVRSILNYLIENGISGCEMECGVAEPFAGAPAGSGPWGGFGTKGAAARANSLLPSNISPAALKTLEANMEKAQPAINKWRVTAPMTKFEEIRRMYADQGIHIYAFKLEPAEASFSDAVFDYAFNVAKALGANQVTMEMPGVGSMLSHAFKPDFALTKRIGAIAAKHKIMVGYHAHIQASPTLWDVPMSQSEYNGINLDIGHYVAAGNRDVVEFIRKNHARITSLHLKDRDYPNHNNGQNEIWGQGDTPLKAILQLMRDQKYTFPASIELEYEIPKGSNPVIESGRCVAWAKDVLLSNGAGISATA